MNYHPIESLEDYYLLHTTAHRDIVLYTADWCNPCKKLKNFLHEEYPELPIPLLIIDVENSDLTDLVNGIDAMPTLEFYEGGKKIHFVKGFNREQVKKLLDEWLL